MTDPLWYKDAVDEPMSEPFKDSDGAGWETSGD